MTDLLLLAAILGLCAAIARQYYLRGKREGWREAISMVKELEEERARREVEEQRAVLRRWQKVCEEETRALEVSRWN